MCRKRLGVQHLHMPQTEFTQTRKNYYQFFSFKKAPYQEAELLFEGVDTSHQTFHKLLADTC
jgi:hypothetical protein